MEIIGKMLGIHQVEVEEKVAEDAISVDGCAVCDLVRTMFCTDRIMGFVAMWDEKTKEVFFLGHRIYKKVVA